MQARYKIQNENCRLRVKDRPSIKCTPAILTFERPHSSNQHVAYITNTRVYVIIEIICLCLNQSCFIPIVLSTRNCDKKGSTANYFKSKMFHRFQLCAAQRNFLITTSAGFSFTLFQQQEKGVKLQENNYFERGSKSK